MVVSSGKIKKKKWRGKIEKILWGLSVIFGLAVASYLFLSGFNRLEVCLGWKKNIIAGFMTSLMAGWVLWSVVIQYCRKKGRRKLADKLSLFLYVFLLVSLLVAFFMNFGAAVGWLYLLLSASEGAAVFYRRLTFQEKRKLKRKFYEKLPEKFF